MRFGECKICKAWIDFDDSVEVQEHVFENETYARPHGYRFAGMSKWLREKEEVLAVNAIPKRFLHINRKEEAYALKEVINLYYLLEELPGRKLKSFRRLKFIRQWLNRILLDEEAFAVYQLMRSSMGSSPEVELCDRLANLFDLPKFWEER